MSTHYFDRPYQLPAVLEAFSRASAEADLATRGGATCRRPAPLQPSRLGQVLRRLGVGWTGAEPGPNTLSNLQESRSSAHRPSWPDSRSGGRPGRSAAVLMSQFCIPDGEDLNPLKSVDPS